MDTPRRPNRPLRVLPLQELHNQMNRQIHNLEIDLELSRTASEYAKQEISSLKTLLQQQRYVHHTQIRKQEFDISSEVKEVADGDGSCHQISTVYHTNCSDFLSTRMQLLLDSNEMVDDIRPTGNLKFIVTGDKGQGTSKLGVVCLNTQQRGSVKAFNLLGLCDGDDDNASMRASFGEVFDQLSNLEALDLIRNNDEVRLEVMKFLGGDIKFICGALGHSGSSSEEFCPLCDVTRRELGTIEIFMTNRNRRNPQHRSFEGIMCDVTAGRKPFTKKPLLKVQLENVVPPQLHIMTHLSQIAVDAFYAHAMRLDGCDGGVHGRRSDYQGMRTKLKRELADVEHGLKKLLLKQKAVNLVFEKMDKNTRRQQNAEACSCRNCFFTMVAIAEKIEGFRRRKLCDDCQASVHLICVGVDPDDTDSSVICELCGQTEMDTAQNFSTLINNINHKIDEARALIVQKSDTVKLQEDAVRKKTPNVSNLEEVLRKEGIKQNLWFEQLTGNQLRKLCRSDCVEKILASFPTVTDCLLAWGRYLQEVDKLWSLCKAAILSNDEIEALFDTIHNVLETLKDASPNQRMTPKLHWLHEHVPHFVYRWRSWGLFSEQAIEATHHQSKVLLETKCFSMPPLTGLRYVLEAFTMRSELELEKILI